MSTTASKQAYFNPDNQVKRLSHKQRCLDALKGEKLGLTYKEVAFKSGLTEQQTWKRCSDLHKEDRVKIIGERINNGSWYSVYAINNQPPLFYAKKLSLKDWLKVNFPDILEKYQVLVEKKL